MGKQLSIGRKIEAWYAEALSCALVLFLIALEPKEIAIKVATDPGLLETGITISAVIFGFLLSILAILSSLGSNSIYHSLTPTNRKKILSFNKRAVFSSAFAMAGTVILMVLKDGPLRHQHEGPFLFLAYFWMVILCYMVLASIRYTTIFYSILNVDSSD